MEVSLSRALSLSLSLCEYVCVSVYATDSWRMGGTAAPEGEREREQLPIMFPLWVSVSLSPSVSFSAPQWSVTDQFHRLSVYNNTPTKGLLCVYVCVCVCVCVGMKYEKSQSQRLGGECVDCGKLKTEYCNARSHTRRCDLNKKKQIGRSASLSRSASSNNRCGWANTRTHKHPHTRAVTPLTTPITEVVGVLINCGLRCYQRPQQQSRLKTDRVHRLSGQRGRRRKGREG